MFSYNFSQQELNDNPIGSLVQNIYEKIYSKKNKQSDTDLKDFINDFIKDNDLLNMDFIINIILSLTELISLCESREITRKQLNHHLKVFLGYEKSSERSQNTNPQGEGFAEPQNQSPKKRKYNKKTLDEKISEIVKKIEKQKLYLKNLKKALKNKKLDKEGIISKMNDKKKSNKTENEDKLNSALDNVYNDLDNGDLDNGDLDDEDLDDGDEESNYSKFMKSTHQKNEDEPAYQDHDGKVVSEGLAFVENETLDIFVPNHEEIKGAVDIQKTTRYDIQLCIKKVTVNRHHVKDSKGQYHLAPIDDVGPKHSKYTWDAIAFFMIVYAGFYMPLSRIAKMIDIPGNSEKITGTSLAEIVEKHIVKFIPIYETFFKLLSEASHLNADDHPVKIQEHEDYMNQVRNLALEYDKDILKKNKGSLRQKEYCDKLAEIQKKWIFFKDEETSYHSLKELENLKREKEDRWMLIKDEIDLLKESQEYEDIERLKAEMKREQTEFSREYRKRSIAAELGKAFGFESQCKNDNNYLTKHKTSLNMTVLTAKLDIHKADSRIVVFRTHLGSAADLLNKIVSHRSHILKGKEKAYTNNSLQEKIKIQTDAAKINILSLENEEYVEHLGCFAHLRRHFIKEFKSNNDYKKLFEIADEKCDFELEYQLRELYNNSKTQDPEINKQLQEIRRHNKIFIFQAILNCLEALMSDLILRVKGFTEKNVREYRKSLESIFVDLHQYSELALNYWEENSNVSKGCKYFFNNKYELFNILCDPYAPLTNNISERLLRGPVLLENALSRRKTYTSAFSFDILRSVIATCEASKSPVREYIGKIIKSDINDILKDPYSYLPHMMREELEIAAETEKKS